MCWGEYPYAFIEHPMINGLGMTSPGPFLTLIPAVVLGYMIGSQTSILGVGAPGLWRGFVIAAIALALSIVLWVIVQRVREKRFLADLAEDIRKAIGDGDASPTELQMVPIRRERLKVAGGPPGRRAT